MTEDLTTDHVISVVVNGATHRGRVEARRTLADFLREDCALTGTHLGCEHGVCGACTVILDGETVRSCLMFAVQADGSEITTVEGLAGADGTLSPVQDAFREEHGLQCGFCTPGFVVTATQLLRENPDPTDDEIREGISGNLCRCTGYQGIVRAVRRGEQRRGGRVTQVTEHTAGRFVGQSVTRQGGPAPAHRPRRLCRRRRGPRDAARGVRAQRPRTCPHHAASTSPPRGRSRACTPS